MCGQLVRAGGFSGMGRAIFSFYGFPGIAGLPITRRTVFKKSGKSPDSRPSASCEWPERAVSYRPRRSGRHRATGSKPETTSGAPECRRRKHPTNHPRRGTQHRATQPTGETRRDRGIPGPASAVIERVRADVAPLRWSTSQRAAETWVMLEDGPSRDTKRAAARGVDWQEL